MPAHSLDPRLSSGAGPLASASGIENSDQVRGASILPGKQFTELHLTSPPKQWSSSRTKLRDSWDDMVGPIRTHTGCEEGLYKPICTLLNDISKWTHERYTCRKAKLRYECPIVFLDHHTTPPSHCPISLEAKPDIIGVFVSKEQLGSFKKRGDVYYDVPSYYVATTCEAKPEAQSGTRQAIRYTYQFLEARPDMPGVYGLCCNSKNYRILWSDPSGPVISEWISWENLKPLEAYIRSLYDPPEGHHLWDPTITSPTLLAPSDSVDPPNPNSELKPHWTIEYGDKIYTNCNQIYAGDSWGRRTTVFMHNDGPGNFAVIKDMYRDDRRRFEEATLLKHIHSEGIFPGVVRPISSGEVDGCDGSSIGTARPAVEGQKEVVHRTKKRLVMGSRGSQLSAAKSVKELLMTVYDGVEVHRALINEKGYLHRDLSYYNFLMYVEHARATLADKGFMKNRPVFIKDILGIICNSEDNCCALLIDADNSAMLTATDDTTAKEVDEELAARTGTPRYIARAVASGHFLGVHLQERTFATMPELHGQAKEVYLKAYGQATYDAYTDVAANTYHRGRLPKPQPDLTSRPWTHRPDHDMESMFWILVYSVILAKPLGASDEPSQAFADAWDTFKNHTIVNDRDNDRRSSFLTGFEEFWMRTLHSKLSPIAEMMVLLAHQVRPEYGYLDPPPKSDHLHEAFRRILLEQILSMEDPIALTPDISRDPHVDERAGQDRGGIVHSSVKLGSTNGNSNKRKAEDDHSAEHPQKSVRSSNGVRSSTLSHVRYIND